MSYKKAMRHHRNPRKFKMTATRMRGALLVTEAAPDPETVKQREALARKLKGK